jgi:CheY-like chemotaxis protein
MKKTAHVLLVEDDEDEVELTRQGFLRSSYDVSLHHVSNGQQCLDYLRNCGQEPDSPKPDLILLDLNMPVMDGREVLTAFSRDVDLRSLPVLVLTSSNAKTDVLFSYRMGCNSFITKPVDFEDFQAVVNTICDFWFDKATLATDLA